MKGVRISLITLVMSMLAVAQNGPGTAVKAGTVVQSTDRKIDAKTAALSKKPVTQQKFDAVAVYQLRVQQEHQSGNHKAEAAAAFNMARASETAATDNPARFAIAEEGYRQAIQAATEGGDPAQKNLATNNLAILKLRQGNKTEALALLKTIDLTSAAPEQRPLFAYNLGRSLELNGDLSGAFERYNAAYNANPEFTDSAAAAFRVLLASDTPRIKEATVISDSLIKNGHSSVAAEQLPALLLKWGDNLDSQWLLAELLRCYTAQRLTPELFKSVHAKILDDAASRFPGLKRPIGEVMEAFLGKLSPVPAPYSEGLQAWNGASWKLDAIAPMLKMIGDRYADQKQYNDALGRYATAWNLARDPEYALAFASLVRRQPELAPQRDYLVSKLVDSMFQYKGEQYRKMNWANILRMHIAIATIFEEEQRWTAPGDTHSAIFQWQHAIEADKQVRAKNPKASLAPGLHFHLANCLAAVGQNDRAADEYLTAADIYIEAQDPDGAVAAIRRVNSLTGLSGNYAERLRAIEVAVKRL